MYPLGTTLLISLCFAYPAFLIASNLSDRATSKLSFVISIVTAIATFAITAISIALYLETLFAIIIGVIFVGVVVCLIYKKIK